MIEKIVPPGVVIVEAYADRPGEPPFPGEEGYIERAVDERRREFITARRCAREALTTLGFPPIAIHRNRRGQPRWPAGVAGSLTHCDGYRAAAVCQSGLPATALGIDAEPHGALPDGALGAVIVPAERNLLIRLATEAPGVHWDRLLFSAKESIFKVWYPVTLRELDFDECRLDIDPATATFTGTILVDAPPGLDSITGRYVIEDGLVATAATDATAKRGLS